MDVLALPWGQDALPTPLAAPPVDVVLAADVLGATADGMREGPGPFGLLLTTLRLFAAMARPPRILLAYKRRLRYRELPFFEALGKVFAITVWQVQGTVGYEDEEEPQGQELAGRTSEASDGADVGVAGLTGHYVCELGPRIDDGG